MAFELSLEKTGAVVRASVLLDGDPVECEVQFVAGSPWREAPGGICSIVWPDQGSELSGSRFGAAPSLAVRARLWVGGAWSYSNTVNTAAPVVAPSDAYDAMTASRKRPRQVALVGAGQQFSSIGVAILYASQTFTAPVKVVIVDPGVYSEDVTVPEGVAVVASAPGTVVIDGDLTIETADQVGGLMVSAGHTVSCGAEVFGAAALSKVEDLVKAPDGLWVLPSWKTVTPGNSLIFDPAYPRDRVHMASYANYANNMPKELPLLCISGDCAHWTQLDPDFTLPYDAFGYRDCSGMVFQSGWYWMPMAIGPQVPGAGQATGKIRLYKSRDCRNWQLADLPAAGGFGPTAGCIIPAGYAGAHAADKMLTGPGLVKGSDGIVHMTVFGNGAPAGVLEMHPVDNDNLEGAWSAPETIDLGAMTQDGWSEYNICQFWEYKKRWYTIGNLGSIYVADEITGPYTLLVNINKDVTAGGADAPYHLGTTTAGGSPRPGLVLELPYCVQLNATQWQIGGDCIEDVHGANSFNNVPYPGQEINVQKALNYGQVYGVWTDPQDGSDYLCLKDQDGNSCWSYSADTNSGLSRTYAKTKLRTAVPFRVTDPAVVATLLGSVQHVQPGLHRGWGENERRANKRYVPIAATNGAWEFGVDDLSFGIVTKTTAGACSIHLLARDARPGDVIEFHVKMTANAGTLTFYSKDADETRDWQKMTINATGADQFFHLKWVYTDTMWQANMGDSGWVLVDYHAALDVG